MSQSVIKEQGDALPTNRSFGLVFATFFLLIGLAPLIGHKPVRWPLVGIAAVFLVLGLANAAILTPLNRLWMKFGALLHKIVSPVVLGIVFFLVLTPMALVIRWKGKDPLRKRLDSETNSYWIEREPRGPTPESMANQF